MRRIIQVMGLSWLGLMSFSGESQAFSGFSCPRFDYAQTSIEFDLVPYQSLNLTITSEALESAILGVKQVYSIPDWRLSKLEYSIPINDCEFSASDPNIFRCDTSSGVIRVSEVDPIDPKNPRVEETQVHWISFSNLKESIELPSGKVRTRYKLNVEGHSNEGGVGFTSGTISQCRAR